MNRLSIAHLVSLLFLLCGLLFSQAGYANKKVSADKVRVVIHVTHNNKRVYQAALNYTYSLLEHYGNKVKIAIVANGPGIGLLNKNNSYTKEIKTLIEEGVSVSACNTTVHIMRKFKDLPIIKGVKFVPTGVVKVIELQREGYLYLHP